MGVGFVGVGFVVRRERVAGSFGLKKGFEGYFVLFFW